ncbi:DUF1611 domain-containing protein [Henriciella aquimarina]|uniref:DUF1611 domain-containing protein n=1 Tax=Henriciella aquimarina TaxID=545261 RepID=UPI000A0112A9|nr:DUF1611 domain-containing protein [Henriciella aquimarina]
MTQANSVFKPSSAAPDTTGQGTTQLKAPYLIYFGDVPKHGYAKTGLGLIHWRRERCAGQMRRDGCVVDGGLPDMDIAEAVKAGARSIVIGVASPGGPIPAPWLHDLADAARAGLDIVSGMHARLADFPELVDAARESGAHLVDIRAPSKDFPVGTGIKRSGKRLLTVGTDCAVGKKYTALALEREMRKRGWDADFRATGQTGIMISGSGIAMDSVVADFLSGAAEQLSPNAGPDHWDVIEGQGSLSHPSFAGVSLGLLHGSQPDALVLCHDPSRDYLLGFEERGICPIQPLMEAMEQCLIFARRVNPAARFVGISINSSSFADPDHKRLVRQFADETGLPVADPVRDGVSAILDHLEKESF